MFTKQNKSLLTRRTATVSPKADLAKNSRKRYVFIRDTAFKTLKIVLECSLHSREEIATVLL